jgi:flagellar FliJ protein
MTSRSPANPNSSTPEASDSLHVLLEATERQRDQAVARRDRARVSLDAAMGQAEQLRDYKTSCQDRWSQQFREGAAITLVQVYHEFVDRLHGAVDLQGRQVERLRGELARCEAETLAAELRVASIDKLIARRMAEKLLKSDRREQKQQDEFAGRMAWQAGQDDGSGSLRFAALGSSSGGAAAYPGAPSTADWTRG